jgi:hypothetical protein
MLSRTHQEILSKSPPPQQPHVRSRLAHREQELLTFLTIFLRDGSWHPMQGERPRNREEAQAELDRLKAKEAP